MIFFALGWIPWLIILAASIIITAATEFDTPQYSTGSLLIGSGLVIWLSKSNPFPWVQSHLLLLLLGVFGYFVIGIVWGFFKWYLFNILVRDKIADGRLKIRTKDDSSWDTSRVSIPLSPRQYKSRIVGWMTYWPWSMVWFVLNDPVRRAWNAIYNRLIAKLEAVSKYVFKNT